MSNSGPIRSDRTVDADGMDTRGRDSLPYSSRNLCRPDSAKSTLLGVLRFLVPKPFVSVEPTGPGLYRTIDREHPTLIIDEADDLFIENPTYGRS